jgi:hypothetical protein
MQRDVLEPSPRSNGGPVPIDIGEMGAAAVTGKDVRIAEHSGQGAEHVDRGFT